jgi:hypothetical protein
MSRRDASIACAKGQIAQAAPAAILNTKTTKDTKTAKGPCLARRRRALGRLRDLGVLGDLGVEMGSACGALG